MPRWARAPSDHDSCRSMPADAGHAHRREERRGREAGAPDDRVDLVQGAVGGPHASRLEAVDAFGDDVDVLAGEGGVPVVGEEQPLATQGVVRDQASAQAGVRHLATQGEPPDRADRGEQRPCERGVAPQGAVEPFGQPEDRAPLGRQGAGEPPEEPVVACGVGPVRLRDDVRRGALEDGQRRDPVDDRRARTGSRSRRCRSRRPAARSGRRRGATARSGRSGRRSCPGSRARPGSTAGRRPRRPGRPRDSPRLVTTCQVRAASSYVAERTSVEVCTRSSSPTRSAVPRR